MSRQRILRKLQITLGFMLLGCLAATQEMPTAKGPSVSMAPVPLTNVTRGKTTSIDLQFRVEEGFHINSNQPAAEYLIPTALKLDPPTDMAIGRITYPQGETRSFPFAPDEKLNVYSGDFTITVQIHPLASVLPTKYELHGTLRYQACDNAQCYRPKNLPVELEVKVVKAPVPPKKNPAQSPHA